MKFIRQQMIRAIPTCTLWRYDYNREVCYLVIASWFSITRMEIEECPRMPRRVITWTLV
jgi:hypothetical protein